MKIRLSGVILMLTCPAHSRLASSQSVKLDQGFLDIVEFGRRQERVLYLGKAQDGTGAMG